MQCLLTCDANDVQSYCINNTSLPMVWRISTCEMCIENRSHLLSWLPCRGYHIVATKASWEATASRYRSTALSKQYHTFEKAPHCAWGWESERYTSCCMTISLVRTFKKKRTSVGSFAFTIILLDGDVASRTPSMQLLLATTAVLDGPGSAKPVSRLDLVQYGVLLPPRDD